VPGAKPTARLSMRCELLGRLILIGVGVASGNGTIWRAGVGALPRMLARPSWTYKAF